MAESTLPSVSPDHSRSKDGLYPLAEACQHSNEAQVMSLLARGANPNTTDSEGYSAIHYSSIRNDTGILRRLLTPSSCDINVRTQFEETPLHLACLNGCLPSVELLSSNEADHTAVDRKGNNILHLAAASGSVDLIDWITHHSTTERQQLINVQNKDGDTPAHLAAKLGNRDAYTRLLRLDSDITLKNKWRRTPPQELQMYNQRDCDSLSPADPVAQRGSETDTHTLDLSDMRQFRCYSEPKLSHKRRGRGSMEEGEEEKEDGGSSGRHSSADIYRRSPSPTTSTGPPATGAQRFVRKPSPLSIVTHQPARDTADSSSYTSRPDTTMKTVRQKLETNSLSSKSTSHIRREDRGASQVDHPGSHSFTNIIRVTPGASPAAGTPCSEHKSFTKRELYPVTPNLKEQRTRDSGRRRRATSQSEKLSRRRVMSAGGGVSTGSKYTPDLGSRGRVKSDVQPKRKETLL